MGNIFISYARVDVAFVQRLCAVLTDHERDPWVDWKDIPPTAEWLEEVYAAIEAADHFVFVISPDSCASETCRLEIEHATQNNKRLVPILYRDVDVETVPTPLAKLNWVLYRDNDVPETARSLLFQALDTDLDWVRAHTRLLIRSIEWNKGERDESLLLRGADLQRALAWLTGASEVKKPAPTPLQSEFVRKSQEAEAHELERVRELYHRALANQLAAQARWLEVARLGALPLAMTLAVESMRRLPSPQAEETLRRCLALHPRRIACFSHDHRVAVVAFSPKGEMLATASGEFTQRESYEAESREKSSLEDFIDQNDLNQFLERGKNLVHDPTGSVAHLWDSFTGRELVRLEHAGSVMSVAFSADGTRLATGSADGSAKVWEIPNGFMLCSVNLAVSPWRGSVALSEDGVWLITQEGEGEARVWEVSTGREAGQRNRKRAIRAATKSDRERTENQTVGLDQSIRRYSLAELEEGVAQLGIYAGSDRNKDVLVGAIAGEVLQRAIAVSPDARFFADANYGTRDSDAVSVCDVLGFECARVAPEGFVSAVVFHPSSRHFCTAVGSEVELWEVEAEATLRLLHSQSDVGNLSFSRDGRYLVTATAKYFSGFDSPVELWDVASGERIEDAADAELRTMLSAAADSWNLVSPDGSLVALREEPDQTVQIRKRSSRRIIKTLKHTGWVQCATFGPKDLLATGTDLAAHVWNARQGLELAYLEHSKQVRWVALDMSGERLATACDDNSAHIWDIASGSELLRVSHEDTVGAVAFSPDGAFLATGGDDNTARLWDIATGKELARLLHNEPVRAVLFSPDGQTLATGSLGGEVALWVCRPDTLIELACERLTRNMTPEEWEHYLPDEPYQATCRNLPNEI